MSFCETEYEIFCGLGPLVKEEIETAQTVHKPKLKFIYILVGDAYAHRVL
jgi:hypothetical protein